ncbi:NERD domain-containing protein [Bacillus sp. FJAT-49705]|uniref:NERD domain-containing protein n=1 Tax=Cytobacillus citreus TaxID=2833586 RepID=A0ABS5NQ53_9BACI|nr:NERD domain-containing protein [Cytobacillus citreus]MBS4189954.1 NERD domain-containing protein [Cytobacillus citreus]
MIIKTRSESAELMILRSLSIRMNLSEKERSNFLNLEKGFIGEQQFDKWFETNFSNEGLILNDLLLESNNTIFQIDSLLITSDVVYLLEIKNYEGDFYTDGDIWSTLSGNEIKNPLLQLKRSESLFRRLLQNFGYNISAEANLIFINPEFFLYQAPLNPSIIFPSQLNRFMDKLNKKSTNIKDRHLKLAKHLVSIQLKNSPYTRLPDYSYDQLEKGIICGGCNTFVTTINKEMVVCNECGYKEDITAAVLRGVMEFRLLFPNQKITTNGIHNWCKIIQSKKTIRRILSRNFQLEGHAKSSYFVNRKENID